MKNYERGTINDEQGTMNKQGRGVLTVHGLTFIVHRFWLALMNKGLRRFVNLDSSNFLKSYSWKSHLDE